MCLTAGVAAQPKKLIVKMPTPQSVESMIASTNGTLKKFYTPHRKNGAVVQSTSQRKSITELQKYAIVKIPENVNRDSMMRRLQRELNPEYIGYTHTFTIEQDNTTDPLRSEQWALDKLEAEKAWKYSAATGVIVAFIDTGIDWTHKDLQHRLWINRAEDMNNNGLFDDWFVTETKNGVTGDIDGIDNDGNGYTDDVIGYNFVDQFVRNVGDDRIRDAFPFDEHGHGTSVAGVIAAVRNNGIGVSGLAYYAQLMSIRAFDATGNAEDDDIASAIIYAVENGARVLNLSFGDVVRSRLVEDALLYAYESGVTVFASSGNSGGQGNHYPSDFYGVISVGSTSRSDKRSVFSSHNTRISLSAPGEGIQTTDVNNGYHSVSGTSFSSPYAAATAALLLEIHPEYTPDQIRTALEVSSEPVNGFQWTLQYGNGRINALHAVEQVKNGTCTILSPANDAVFSKRTTNSIAFIGTVTEPMMESWSVRYAHKDDGIWTEFGKGTTFIQKDTLGVLQLENVKDTTIITSLYVTLRNKRVIEYRIRCIVEGKQLVISDAKVYNPWYEGKRIFVVTATTNQPAKVYVQYAKDTSYHSVSEQYIGRELNLFGKTHSIVIENNVAGSLRETNAFDVEVIAVNETNDTAKLRIPCTYKEEYFQRFGFDKKPYSAPRLYLNNYSNGYAKDSTVFLASDLTTDNRYVGAYKYSNSSIQKVDSLKETWFVRGVGDVNGDGFTDTWAQQGATSKLFSGEGGRVFGKVLFGDSVNSNFWASRIADVTGDNKPELLAYRNNNFEVWQSILNGFKLIDTIPNTTRPTFNKQNNSFSSPGCAVGDFDKDGKIEVAFSDSDGDIVISEFHNGTFKQEFSFTNPESAGAGTEFTTEADIDGDGTPEILTGSPANMNYNVNNEYDAQLWVFRILQSKGSNTYKEIWKDYFYGVRYGRPFYNCDAAGNVNASKGDEVVLTLFPSLYSFTKRQQDSTITPLWYKPLVYSNSVMINDFDKNGKKELAFVNGQTMKTEFWEMNNVDTSDYPPILKKVRVTSDSTFVVTISSNSERYNRVYYRLVGDTTTYSRAGTGTIDIFNNTVKNGYYKCWLTTVEYITNREGPTSDTFYVQLHSLISPVFIDSVNLNDSYLRIHFDGLVAQKEFDYFLWQVGDGVQDFSISSVISSGDSTIDVHFVNPLQTKSNKIFVRFYSFIVTDIYGEISKKQNLIAYVRQPALIETIRFNKLNSFTALTLTIQFSEPVDSTALNKYNYQLQPFGIIENIEYSNAEKTQITITLNSSKPLLANGSTYTLIGLPSIKGTSSNVMTTQEGNALSFVFSASDACSSFTFPQPFKYGKDEYLKFGCVPQNATVLVLTMEGVTITSITETDNNGGVQWQPVTPFGEPLASGIYLYKVIKADGTESELHKFLITR